MALRAGGVACISAARQKGHVSNQWRRLAWNVATLPCPSLTNTVLPFSGYQKVYSVRYSIDAIQESSDPSTRKKGLELPPSDDWKIKMLYDGECPLCMREVNMLREKNIDYRTIKFVDISSEDYSPEENQGLDYETAMGRIHAIIRDGTVVTDVEAFRRLYEQVGLGWVYAITKYEPIATIADVVYGVWAKYRLKITGRPGLEQILARRKNKGQLCRPNNG